MCEFVYHLQPNGFCHSGNEDPMATHFALWIRDLHCLKLDLHYYTSTDHLTSFRARELILQFSTSLLTVYSGPACLESEPIFVEFSWQFLVLPISPLPFNFIPVYVHFLSNIFRYIATQLEHFTSRLDKSYFKLYGQRSGVLETEDYLEKV